VDDAGCGVAILGGDGRVLGLGWDHDDLSFQTCEVEEYRAGLGTEGEVAPDPQRVGLVNIACIVIRTYVLVKDQKPPTMRRSIDSPPAFCYDNPI
jgi:hypothetical protein